MGILKPVRVVGPLELYARGFGERLATLGYTASSAEAQMRLMATLSRWMARNGHAAGDLTAAEGERFVAQRRERRRTQFTSSKALTPVLEYLRGLNVAPQPDARILDTPVEQLLARYRRYLLSERGLADGTVRYYTDMARLLLSQRAGAGGALREMTAADVSDFVLSECRRRGPGSAGNLATALRSLLRFLHLDGVIGAHLAAAVPTVAHWRGTGLPRALPPAQATMLLNSCDRDSDSGRRDYAMLLLLGRLGLRAGEVAALTLDDLNWWRGEVVIRGKGSRVDRLPMPSDVGEALASHLRLDRPSTGYRNVFLRLRAAHRPLSVGGVQAAVAAAAARAGVAEASAHRLRHTAATEMLRHGARLTEIGQVLRHRDVATTALYAKVDHSTLQTLAKPWPGGAA